jgi:hypothetical protein
MNNVKFSLNSDTYTNLTDLRRTPKIESTEAPINIVNHINNPIHSTKILPNKTMIFDITSLNIYDIDKIISAETNYFPLGYGIIYFFASTQQFRYKKNLFNTLN